MSATEAQERLVDLTRTTCLVALDKAVAIIRERGSFATRASRCGILANRMCQAARDTGMVLDQKWRV